MADVDVPCAASGLVALEHVSQHGFGACQLPISTQEVSIVGQCIERVRMALAQHALQKLQRFDIERRSFGKSALPMECQSEILDMHCDLRMILAEGRAIDIEGRFVELRGAVVLAAL